MNLDSGLRRNDEDERARLFVPATRARPGHHLLPSCPPVFHFPVVPSALHASCVAIRRVAGARSSASRVVRLGALFRAPAVATLGYPRSRSGTEDGRTLRALSSFTAFAVAGFRLVFRPYGGLATPGPSAGRRALRAASRQPRVRKPQDQRAPHPADVIGDTSHGQVGSAFRRLMSAPFGRTGTQPR
jgi:hypothetical protein